MEGTRVPGAGAEEPSGVWGVKRAEGCSGNWRASSAPLCGAASASVYNRTHGKWQAAKRQSEGGRSFYRSAKAAPTRRFHAVYDHVARSDVLWQAWEDARTNRGAPGVDGHTIADVEAAGLGLFLRGLADSLKAGTFRPAPLRWVHIPKPDGRTRPLGIPTVADRVVMAAAKIVLEPIFEADFSPVSFGFRPGRSAIDACEAVRQAANRGNNWGLDADVSDCFGSIDHDALVAQVALSASDRRMLRLLRSWLRVGVMESGEVSDTTSGTPQGSPISPLLANIALTVVDKRGEPVGWHLGVLVRYAAIHDARPLRSAPSAMAITCRWDELADRLYEAYGDIADDIQCYSVVDYWHDEPDAGDQWNDVNRRFRDLVTTRS